MLYPFIFSFVISFSEWNGIGEIKWIGFDNYIKLVRDEIFIQSIMNGIIIFFMYVPLMLFLALVLAVILNNSEVKFRGFFRTTIFIPNITSVVAVSFVFALIFDTKYGFLNMILSQLGIEPVSWLGTPLGARVAVSSLVTWRWLGYNMVLMLAGLQNISKELFEAADIDGANKVQSFFSITIPLMKPVILFCTVLSTIGTFSLFTEPMLLTGGGPMYKTITPVLYIYRESFQYLRMGYASSVAYIYFILMFVFTLLQFRLSKSMGE
jgi:ABC-type sugar transport system permease subunit